MRKIPTLFVRDISTRLVTPILSPDCGWVLAGEGVATEKYDGTCCLVRGGELYKRYDAKRGKTPPPGFEPAQEYDPVTGHMPGWIAVGDGPEDQWHIAGFGASGEAALSDGTYELIGPKVQGNPYGWKIHFLLRHGARGLPDAPRNFEDLRAYLAENAIEGIVWRHPDGRMVKIKRRDFGLPWPMKDEFAGHLLAGNKPV